MNHYNNIDKLKQCSILGISKGWQGFLWMVKIIVPVSFLTSLFAWSGWLEDLGFVFRPVMGFLSLPDIASIPLMVGMLVGPYAGIAAMAVLPLTVSHMTLIAVFILIAHNLIQEGIIQGKSGIGIVKATLFRIIFAVMAVIIVAPFLDMNKPDALSNLDPGTFNSSQSLWEVVVQWGKATGGLTLKIFFIIIAVLTILELLKGFGIIERIVKVLSPVLRIMGLSNRVAVLWVTAAIFGISYGGAVIVEEVKKGAITDEDLESLHLSIGINHSMIEDAALFLPFGINLFWLYVPRLILAMVAVRLLSLWRRLKD